MMKREREGEGGREKGRERRGGEGREVGLQRLCQHNKGIIGS